MSDDCTDKSGRPECKLGLGNLAAERYCRIAELEALFRQIAGEWGRFAAGELHAIQCADRMNAIARQALRTEKVNKRGER